MESGDVDDKSETQVVSDINTKEKNSRSLWKLIAGSSVIASMCCLPSVVLVMFGIATVSTGAALSDTLYWGEDGYSWFGCLVFLSWCLHVPSPFTHWLLACLAS